MLDEKSGSELEDKLEIVKWRENKAGKLLVLCFYLPISILEENVSSDVVVYFFSGRQLQDLRAI